MKALAIMAIAARVAAADPAAPRVVTAPTAWLPGAGTLVGSAGLDHRLQPAIAIDAGLGELAAVELGADSDVRTCTIAQGCDTDHLATPRLLPRAAFRIGAPQDAWFTGQPAVVLGARVTIGDPPAHGLAIGEVYVAASRELGPVRLHAGADLLAARDARGEAFGPRLRPFGAIELTPPQYPRTTLVGDLAWVPRFDAGAPPTTEWLAGWGVRYQALSWGAIELDVRHREGEGLAGSTVMMSVTGVWQHAQR